MASAQNAAWCANMRNGSSICAYGTMHQCRSAVAGLGGFCAPNPWAESKTRAAPEGARSAAGPGPAPAKKKAASGRKEKRQPVTAARERPAPRPPASRQMEPRQVEPRRIDEPPPSAIVTLPDGASLRSVMPSQTPASAPDTAPLLGASPFEAGRKLILEGKYDAGIAALQPLHYDDNADVAAYIGLAQHRLKRSDEARIWFERALVAEPYNLVALAGYGALLAEQGRLAQAMNNLDRIRTLCGVGCAEYRDLDRAIAGRLR